MMIPQTLKDKQVVSHLVDTLVVGIGKNRMQDAEVILSAMRRLRPQMIELDALEAWICVQRGLWPEAVRLLRNVDANRDAWSLGKAFLAYALFFSGDPTWRISANEVLESSTDPNAIALVNSMLNPEEAGEEAAQVENGGRSPDAAAVPSFQNFLRA